MPHILSEENREIQEMAREFAEAKIRPVSKEYDLRGETPLSVYKEAAGLGYTSLCIPEEFGGAGLGTFANILVAEEFARADAGFSAERGFRLENTRTKWESAFPPRLM